MCTCIRVHGIFFSLFFAIIGSCDDVFHQLEREVSASNNVISKQQDEIAELHQVVCMLKRVRLKKIIDFFN